MIRSSVRSNGGSNGVSNRGGRTTGRLVCRSVLSMMMVLAGGACEDDPDPTVDGGVTDGPVQLDAVAEVGDGALPDGGDTGPVTTSTLTILHTNDLHSHLQGHGAEADYTPATPNDDMTVGGFSRLATAIGTHKAMAAGGGNDVLLLDGGDFMMGTLFHLAATTGAAELRMMQAVGYDAVAIGNHEYDWSPRGLAAILKAAYVTATPPVQFPLLASNLKFSATSAGDDELEMLAGDGKPIRRKFVKTLPSGLKVGFFGLLGREAAVFAPTAAPLTFEAIATTATAMVAELRGTDKVDLVVALSHSGINASMQGEDRTLAEMVPGIDVIVSGHTHDKLTAPAIIGKTIIVTAGSRGEFLGRLDLTVSKSGGAVSSVAVKNYTLLPINDQLTGNPAVQAQIDGTITALDAALAPFSLTYKKVMAETDFDLPRVAYREFGLGNLITDAYRATVGALQPDEPPPIAVEGSGSIRASIEKGKTGNILFSDLYRVLPLGIGPNQMPNYPLVTFYLNAKDLKSSLEIAAGASSPALNSDSYFLQVAGMEADYNMAANLFQRVTAIRVVPPTGGAPVAIDLNNTTTCYKMVTTIYLAAFLSQVSAFSGGLLSAEAKQKDCTTKVTDLASRIVDANPGTVPVDELKQYQALVGYVGKLPDSDMPADGIPNIPAVYKDPQGRIKQTP